jgi:hypothetical protein
MQDTFELQGTMLHAVFPRTWPEIVVQRVGDPNQAIFDDSEAEPDKSDLFPDAEPGRNLSIPNSYRFGPDVAALASPFAITPVGTAGLSGIGPKLAKIAPTACRHAIFIFPDSTTAGLLDAYGKHLLETFGEDALASSVVTAVGAIHKDASEVPPGHPQFPKSVPHYWSGYKAEIGRKNAHPRSFVQYIRVAQAAVRDGRDLSPGVEKLASGLVRLAERIGNTGHIKRRARTHRVIVDALEADATALAAYRRFLKMLLIDWMPLTEQNWHEWRTEILAIACSLCDGDTKQTNAAGFLAWSEDDQSLAGGALTSLLDAGPNVYRVLDGERCVDIRLGSIHSVKGQTHLATLLLNTFWHAHSSQQILPWLLGTRINGVGARARDRKRLLQTYVAMTRPSHMICLAVPRSILRDDETSFAKHVATLRERGWRVAEIIEGSLAWHD